MEKNRRCFRLSCRCCAFSLGLFFLLLSAPRAEEAYIWRDKEGRTHFSGQMPAPGQAGGEIQERHFQNKEDLGTREERPVSRSPIEHAVHCTFRLSNKRGGGSGFFVNDRGIAVTARHVVKGVEYSMKAEVPGDKKKYRVRILKKSRKYDLALVKVAIDRPTPWLEFKSPEELVQGEEVYAIGNPLLAFRETVTQGTFSRIFPEKDFRKELKMKPPYKGDWVQFSASVTGGNSGGPVVDEGGKLIGVVSLGFKAYAAINLAVPSTYILEEFASLIR